MHLQCAQTGIFGVNTWIIPVCKNAVVIVDPDCSDVTGDGKAFVSWLKKNKAVPIGIFLTHGHFDHIAGTGLLKNAFPFAKIAIHKDDSHLIGKTALENQGYILEGMGYSSFNTALENLPDADVFVEDSKDLSTVFDAEELCADEKFSKLFKGNAQELKKSLSEWKVIWTPGHTKGSCCLYSSKEKKLISGDTVFYLSYGRTDLPGGDGMEMRNSLKLLNRLIPGDTEVYPGHDRSGFLLKENAGVY